MSVKRRLIAPVVILAAAIVMAGCGSSATTSSSIAENSSSPLPQPAGSVSCAPFGCTGNGTTDDTLTIRAALRSVCQQGGGTLYLPVGKYRLSIQDRDELAALTISCSNVSIQGAGHSFTTLSVYAIGGADPDSVCPLNSKGNVNRGSGIYVAGSRASVTSNVHITGLRMTGNRIQYTNRDGHYSFPATVNNCFNVWDTSNNGIFFQQDVPRTNNTVLDCEIDHFSGQLIYGGGGSSQNPGQQVSNNILHNSNGDAISISGGATITGNTIYEIASNGIEDNSNAGQQFIQNNQITTVKAGIVLAPIASVPNPPAWDVSNNTINDAQLWGILVGASASHIYNNVIENSAWNSTCCYAALAVFNDVTNYPTSVVENVEINNNTISANSVQTQFGFGAIAGDSPAGLNISIHDNSLISASPGTIKAQLWLVPGTTGLTLLGNMAE